MRLRLALILAVLVVGVEPGWADVDLPSRNVDSLCRSGFARNAAQQSQCVLANQDAYDVIKDAWNTIPDEVKTSSINEIDGMQSSGPWFYVYFKQILERRENVWAAQHIRDVPRFQP